jgi:bifunctional DNA-binding transcriptional regulator/antitoxin component of YhaV-PrlF toxin-antitoxin module
VFNSKLTSKYQTTIPKEVCQILKVKVGDRITFEIRPDKTITIRKTQPLDLAFAKAVSNTLEEWESEADKEAYHRL